MRISKLNLLLILGFLLGSALAVSPEGKSAEFYNERGWIPTDKVVAIDHVEFWEGEHRYRANPAVRSWIYTRKISDDSPGKNSQAFTSWQGPDHRSNLLRDQPPSSTQLKIQPIKIISIIFQ